MYTEKTKPSLEETISSSTNRIELEYGKLPKWTIFSLDMKSWEGSYFAAVRFFDGY